jgi:hypothetical protein
MQQPKSSARLYNGQQPDFMSDETFAHFKIVREFPLYWETRMWHPVLLNEKTYRAAIEWLQANAVRGTAEARNDWLHPTGMLVLIRDEQLAVECKMRWS